MTINQLLKQLKQKFPDFEWTIPPKLSLGILTTNRAFILAKQEKKNPVEIASNLKTEIQEFLTTLDSNFEVSLAGPYINISLNKNYWQKAILEAKNPFLEKKNKTLLLEFISPNVGKPLHAGHILQANFGESLRKILSLKYQTVITNSHWGDWGVPLGIMIWAWKQLQNKSVKLKVNNQEESLTLQDFEKDPMYSLVKMYIWGNQVKDEYANWDQEVRNEVSKLENGDTENLALKDKFFKISSTSCHRLLTDLNIKIHDLEQGESFYEKDVKLLVDFFEKHDLWQKEGKGRFIDLKDLEKKWQNKPRELEGKLKHFGRCYLIQSKDGYTTYALRDIAARIQWARDLKADFMITMVGNEQKHHFNQFFSILCYISSLPEFEDFVGKEVAKRLNWGALKAIHNGFMTLPEGKMSTRKGNFVTARDILDLALNKAKETLNTKTEEYTEINIKSQKVAVAAMKWFNLNKDISQDTVLDLDSIMSFEGNTGVYQLYTIARINTIIKKQEDLELTNQEIDTSKLNELELEILNETFTREYTLEQISQNYKPHLLCNYLFSLSSKINTWYAKYSVSSETDKVRKITMLTFCKYLSQHLKQSLDLLGIESVEKL
jgi:arginyl-tRNA synthetase